MDYFFLVIIYKITALLCGVFICFLGYKLFLKGVFNESGDIDAKWNDKGIIIKKAAPGTFFALFGAIVIAIVLYKGLEYESVNKNNTNEMSTIQKPKFP